MQRISKEEVVLFEEAGMGRGDETSDTFMGPC